MADSQLFDDHFTITGLNQQKYDRVTRIVATSLDNNTSLTLDINHELYPVATGETLKIVLASTLNLDGTKEDKGWREQLRSESTLADMYDYVCHGKVYRFEEGEKDDLSVSPYHILARRAPGRKADYGMLTIFQTSLHFFRRTPHVHRRQL